MNLRASLTSLLVCAGAPLAACDGPYDPDHWDDVVLPPDVAENCPPLYSQDRIADFYLDFTDREWAAIQYEFEHRVELEAAGQDYETYHPVEFRHGADGAPVPNVLVRLKGASSWLQTLQYDDNPRMQFVIAMNEVNPDGRYQGVRKIELDMPRTDETFLRQRLALYALRRLDVPAQCAGSARLHVNGEYYGLYTSLERMDKEYIQRRWPEADDGDLWKGGRVIKTNEETFSWDRVDRLWHMTSTPEQLDELADMDASLDEWAAEAVIGDADGYYNGRANFYLYDHPQRGFIWLPQDLDTVFAADYLPPTASPIWPSCMFRWERDWMHYLMTVNDPVWQERYVDALARALARFDVAALQERVDRWSEQIRQAADRDPHRPFAMADHDRVVGLTRQYIAERGAYLEAWLGCRGGGAGTDADGDGFKFCVECDDSNAAAHPGAVEVCNGVDDDCDGAVDDGASCP